MVVSDSVFFCFSDVWTFLPKHVLQRLYFEFVVYLTVASILAKCVRSFSKSIAWSYLEI